MNISSISSKLNKLDWIVAAILFACAIYFLALDDYRTALYLSAGSLLSALVAYTKPANAFHRFLERKMIRKR